MSLVWVQGQAAPEASAGIPPGHGEFTDFPPQEAGGASPCPIHGEITASWFQAEWTGAQTMGTLGILLSFSSFKLAYPTCHEGLPF